MSERITGELRRAMRIGYAVEDGEQVDAIRHGAFMDLCAAIDSIHANLERENDRLKCELDRVLGELDEMHKTEEISDNSGGFMHEGSITDELRDWFKDRFFMANGWQEIHDIADRIDAEYERTMAAAAFIAGVPITDETMAEHGWVRLPVDADGVPIRVGDELDGYGKTIEVVELRYGRSGWVLISREGNGYADTVAFTHHKPDTWERIIEDALTMPIHSKADVAQFVARCKALAGDAE